MNGNPYYVKPLGDNISGITQGLSGLGQVRSEKRQIKDDSRNKGLMQQDIMEAVNSGDPAKMAEVSIKYPEMRQQLDDAVGYANPDTKGLMEEAYVAALSSDDALMVAEGLEQAAQKIQAMGGQPTNILDDARKLRENPAHLKSIQRAALYQRPDLLDTWKATQVKEQAIPQLPQSIVKGLDQDSQQAASDIYAASGGGQKGIAEVQKAMPMLKAEEGLKALPEALVKAFPNASEAEREEIDAAVSGAKSAQEGMKAATKVRTEQRRLEKAKVHQERAIMLLERIANAEDLEDVVGGFEGSEGSDWMRWDQEESDIIADVNEVQNMLTAENLDIMTGVLSESDIKIIASLAGGALDRTRGESVFKADVTKLLEKLRSKMAMTTDDKAKFRDEKRSRVKVQY